MSGNGVSDQTVTYVLPSLVLEPTIAGQPIMQCDADATLAMTEASAKVGALPIIMNAAVVYSWII